MAVSTLKAPLQIDSSVSMVKSSVANNSTVDIHFSNGQKGLILVVAAGSAKGAYLVNTSSGGSLSVGVILAATGLTYSIDLNELTFSNAAGAYVTLLTLYF